MKKIHRGMKLMAALFLSLSVMAVQKLYAAEPNAKDAAATIAKQDSGVKAQIKEAKHKIAEERENILAADRRLSQVKKTGDKAAIEQTKKEVDAEIKERKSAISVLKSEIEKLQDGGGSLAPSGKRALQR